MQFRRYFKQLAAYFLPTRPSLSTQIVLLRAEMDSYLSFAEGEFLRLFAQLPKELRFPADDVLQTNTIGTIKKVLANAPTTLVDNDGVLAELLHDLTMTLKRHRELIEVYVTQTQGAFTSDEIIQQSSHTVQTKFAAAYEPIYFAITKSRP